MDSVASLFVPEHVKSSLWHKFIYKSSPIDGSKKSKSAAEVCSILDPIEINNCDMVFMDDLFCYFGNFSFDNGTALPKGGFWDLYIKKGSYFQSNEIKRNKNLKAQCENTMSSTKSPKTKKGGKNCPNPPNVRVVLVMFRAHF